MPEYNTATARSVDEDEDWSESAWRQLVMRGANYREDYEFEMFGQTEVCQIGPLKTPVYENLMGEIQSDMSDEQFNRMMQQLKEMETAQMSEDEVAAQMDMSIAVGQIGALVEAAKFGIDPESVDLPSRAAVSDTVDHMIGGKAVDIGVAVMELTDDLEAADEFPGSRTGD